MSFSRSTLSERSGWASRSDDREPAARIRHGPGTRRRRRRRRSPRRRPRRYRPGARTGTRAVIKICSISSSSNLGRARRWSSARCRRPLQRPESTPHRGRYPSHRRPAAPIPGGRGLSEEPGVGDAVQCDAASQSELLASRPLVEPAAQVKQDFLQHGLNTAGEVGVPLIEIGPGLAGRRERGPIHGLGAKAAVAGGVDQLTKRPMCRGVPYEASAMTLYSSLERSKPRCAVRSS